MINMTESSRRLSYLIDIVLDSHMGQNSSACSNLIIYFSKICGACPSHEVLRNVQYTAQYTSSFCNVQIRISTLQKLWWQGNVKVISRNTCFRDACIPFC
jgi:hypothetical protein